jgi:ParB/RepB/Spo0J family partition protein
MTEVATRNPENVRITVDLTKDVYINPELNARMLGDSEAKVQELAAQIETTNGLLQAIGVYKTPESRLKEHGRPYELGFGYRRCAALAHLAESTGDQSWILHVPATLKEEATTQQRYLDQLIENYARRDMHPIELANAMVRVIDDPEAETTQAELGRLMGISEPVVSKYIKVARTLSDEVQSMCLDEKFSYSHALVIADAGLPEDQQKIAATTASTMTYAEFKKHMDETYRKDGEAKGDEEAPTGEATEAGPQRLNQGIPPRQIKEKYLPHFEEELKNAKSPKDKAKWQERVDTAKFMLKIEGTNLGAELQPWEILLEEQKAAEQAAKQEQVNREKYIRTACQLIDETLAWEPPLEAQERKKFTLADALGKVKSQTEGDLKKAQDAGLGEGVIPAVDTDGKVTPAFKLGKMPEEFQAEIGDAWRERRRLAEERKQKGIEARKKKKEEEERKAAEAQAVAEAAAPPVAETAGV